MTISDAIVAIRSAGHDWQSNIWDNLEVWPVTNGHLAGEPVQIHVNADRTVNEGALRAVLETLH